MTRDIGFVELETRRDRRQSLLCRVLLYGAPFLAAALHLSIRGLVLRTGIVSWGDMDGLLYVGNGLLAALVSAAGALWLPNHVAVRIAHAISAAFVSAVSFALLLAFALHFLRHLIPF